MSRRVYLHVGAPKTGTTYLQDRLSANRRNLADHAVHYPLGLRASHFGAALDLIDVSWGGMRAEVRGDWDALMARVRRHQDTVVLSQEILAAATPGQVRKAMTDLAGSEVHLVYSARDLARQIPAEWQEGLKHRRRRTFAQFLRLVQTAPRSQPTLWFWRVQSLPDVLTRWGAGLPPGHVHLVTVPPPGAAPDELWLRYCRAFGIDPAWAPNGSGRENASIGTAEAVLLRKLNQRLGKSDVSAQAYRRLVRQLVVHETLAQRPRMTRVTLPPDSLPWATGIAEEWIAWVQSSGIDVIGDLDDLRPAVPAGAERWSNPDTAAAPRVLDAALDALAALTVEAARRPDPRDRLTARIGRAARRLRGR